MTVATLIRQIAAKRFTVALLGRNGRSMNNIFRPLRRGLHPLDELPRMFAPPRIFFRMQQNVASELQRYNLVHVLHVWTYVFEIADPYVVDHWIFHQPVPRAVANPLVRIDVALPQPNQFVEQHDW